MVSSIITVDSKPALLLLQVPLEVDWTIVLLPGMLDMYLVLRNPNRRKAVVPLIYAICGLHIQNMNHRRLQLNFSENATFPDPRINRLVLIASERLRAA
jgi:hypothetical protein